MNELSDEARALFYSARDGHEPDERDRERVRQAVLLRVGAVVATSAVARVSSGAMSGTSATAASSGSGVLVGKTVIALKLVLGLAAVGSIGTGAYYAARSTMDPSGAPHIVPSVAAPALRVRSAATSANDVAGRLTKSTAPTERAPVPTSETSAAAPSSPPPNRRRELGMEKTMVPESAATPITNTPGSTFGSGPAVAAFPNEPPPVSGAPVTAVPPALPLSSGLSLEAQGLSQVQRAVRDGRNAEALTLLDAQERAFLGGKLTLERQAARIIALCGVGRQTEARALAARFLTVAPDSLLAARVRKTCAGP